MRVAALLFLGAACFLAGCPSAESPKTAANPQADSTVALKVNGIPIYKSDVERLAKHLQWRFSNMSFSYASSVALVNTLIPRAAAVSYYSDKVEDLRLQIEKLHERVAAGEDMVKLREEIKDVRIMTEDIVPAISNQNKLDLLLSEWLLTMKPGELSQPVLTRYGWFILQMPDPKIEDTLNHDHHIKLHILGLCFGSEELNESQIRDWVNQAEIQIVDPEYERIVPEWLKYRTDARNWMPVDVNAGSVRK